MADPFSIAVGAIAVVEVCKKLGTHIYQLQKDVAGIHEELERLEAAIDGLRDSCDSVRAKYEARSSHELSGSIDETHVTGTSWLRVGKVLHNCHKVVEKLEVIIDNIVGQTNGSFSNKIDTVKKTIKRRKWEEEIRSCRLQMAAHQQSLQLLLQVIISHDIGNSHDYNTRSFEKLSKKLEQVGENVQLQITDAQESIQVGEDSQYNRATLSALKDLQDSVEFSARSVKSASSNHHFDIPQSVSSMFTGRDSLLEELRRVFIPGQYQSQFQRRFIIHGLGGSGKTQFCCKFAQENRESFWGVFWVDASTPDRAKQTLGDIAVAAKLDKNENSALHWLSNLDETWLLIIDNADDDDVPLEQYFPKGNRGNVLVTTRNPAYRIHGNVGPQYYEFSGLEVEEATKLLLRASASPSPWDSDCEGLARNIAQVLGALALAIVQAGAAIRDKLCELKDYLGYYNESWDRIRRVTVAAKASLSDEAVYSTWEICYSRLEHRGTEASQDAMDLLNIMAFLHWETIPREIFIRALKDPAKEPAHVPEQTIQNPAPFDRLREAPGALIAWLCQNKSPAALPGLIRDGRTQNIGNRIPYALNELARMSLIHLNNNHTYSMHPIVHKWARQRPKMKLAEQALWADMAGRVLAASIDLPSPVTTPADEKTTAAAEKYHIGLLAHVDHVQLCRQSAHDEILKTRAGAAFPRRALMLVASLVPALGPDPEKTMMYAKFGFIYAKCGHWSKAEGLMKEVVKVLCRYLGPQHERSRRALLFLATIYWHQGRGSDAAELQIFVHRLCKSHLGPSHLDTINALGQLGYTRWQQGQYTIAREMQEEVLEKLQQCLAPNHPEVLKAKDNLGLTMCKFWDEHHFKQSYQLHHESMTGMIEVLRPHHEQTLFAKEHFCRTAVLLGGKYAESTRDLMSEVLERRQESLGKEHSSTLLAMANMAIVLTARGEYDEAEELVRRGLPIAERTLGPNHIGTLFGNQTWATVLLQRRDYTGAEKVLSDVTERQKHMASHRGDYHPDRLGALIQLARCFYEMGKIDRAIETCDEAIHGFECISKEEHPLATGLRVARSQMMDLSSSTEHHEKVIFPFTLFKPGEEITNCAI